MPIRQKITPFLWFDDNAEEAVNFYVSIFADSHIDSITRRGDDSIVAIAFTLEGQSFAAINGGPHFKMTEAVSLFVDCADQAEIERFWSKLGADGAEKDCGWLTDRFGVTWQINSQAVIDMLQAPDVAAATRVMQEMMKMTKIDLPRLRQAYGAA
jgi:predicted 3-demethylubiquinone-9 3-methyltransferase (glyoxalase superfamily)